MEVKEYSPLHYTLIQKWWFDWGWNPCPTPEMLSTSGVVVFNDDVPLVSGFLYKTDSCIAWIEHIVSNKDADTKDRALAIEVLIETLTKKAKDAGFLAVLTSSEHQGLINSFLRRDYTITENKTTILMKVL